MTLKAAWITPCAEGSQIFSLTLESAGVSDVERLSTHDHVFPLTPEAAPKRHTTVLSVLTDDDLDLLRHLLNDAVDLHGCYTQHRTSKEPPTTEETLNAQ
jgi:hypothetical protein